MKITPEIIAASKALPPFILPMRKALRDGSKTQTRRLLKADNHPAIHDYVIDSEGRAAARALNEEVAKQYVSTFPHARIICPYGKTGEIRYLKEPLIKDGNGFARYGDTPDIQAVNNVTGKPIKWRWKRDLQTAMYMPKEAARFFVRRTITKVERVGDISEADAMAEGIIRGHDNGIDNLQGMFTHDKIIYSFKASIAFRDLWDSINAKRGHPFRLNEWVWVIGMEKL